ncbi:MAG: PQQ-binding-like beta-propeller repeat protein, partial [Vicinamibacteraceae bacterium]
MPSIFALVLWLTTSLASATAATPVDEPDWPQWRGPNRTGISDETGLLTSWPEGGPKVAWSVKGLGAGYGSVSIQDQWIFVQGTEGNDSVVFALNRADGKRVWTRSLGPTLEQDRGPGPRGTPTVDGEHIYALTEAGDLASV